MSISKKQAEIIADGFLDSLGSSDLAQIKPKNILTEVVLIAGELVEDMQDNLNASNTNATGALSSSIEVSEPEVEGTAYRVDIFMNYYGKFQNKGVKGTRSGSGLYAFKHEFPSTDMIKNIQAWIDQGKLKIKNVNKTKTTYATEKKNVRLSELNAAYAVSVSIKQHGIKATGFLDKAISKAQAKVRDRLGLSLIADLRDALIP